MVIIMIIVMWKMNTRMIHVMLGSELIKESLIFAKVLQLEETELNQCIDLMCP